MLTKKEPMSMLNIAGGVVPELFDRELEKLVKNALDPNTVDDFKPEINLKVKFVPSKTPGIFHIEVFPSSKLAPYVSQETAAQMGKNARGDGEIFEFQRRKEQQMEISDKVISMGDKKEAASD